MTADIIGISKVTKDTEGNLTIAFSPALIKQMGWANNTIVEWEVIGNMAVIRRLDHGSNN